MVPTCSVASRGRRPRRVEASSSGFGVRPVLCVVSPRRTYESWMSFSGCAVPRAGQLRCLAGRSARASETRAFRPGVWRREPLFNSQRWVTRSFFSEANVRFAKGRRKDAVSALRGASPVHFAWGSQ